MKKQHTFVYLLSSLLAPLLLQSQTITDVNFAAAIRNVCPTCINASNVLQTPATTLTSLDVSGEMITNLSGIGGFTALQRFECISNLVTNLPALPTSLNYLDITNNQIATLPTLPNGLTTLNCGANRLSSLPTLPTGLTVLDCASNPFTTLPNLPNGLINLQCYGGNFTTLPTLPNGLRILNCGDGKLTTLPTLPSSLTTFFCYNNPLTSLPNLPASLTWLSCGNTRLSNLPSLPTGLLKLFCGVNPLRQLPTLPTTLTHLDCRDNQLTQLPSLPTTLKILYCYDNQITRLPPLPSTLTDLIMDVSITCIPNQVVGMTIYDKDSRVITRPICPVIPIELMRFEAVAKDKTVVLTWQTASEINVSHFDILRSADGVVFHKIGTQKAANKANIYPFTDASPLFPITYYRLITNDLDGSIEQSKTLAVANKRGVDTNGRVYLRAYPSVTTGILTVETDLNGAFQVINLLGQVVKTSARFETSPTLIDVSALPQGTYFLKVGTEQVKFVKQ